MHEEAVLPAETHEVIDMPCPILPKRKMIAHEQFRQGERAMQDVFGKLIRAHRREGGGKVQEDHFIDSRGFEVRKLFLRTGEEAKIDAGCKDFYRMWFEGQHERSPLCLLGRLDHCLQQRSMAQVVAVEIAERGDRIGTWTLTPQPTRHFQHGRQRRRRAASLAKYVRMRPAPARLIESNDSIIARDSSSQPELAAALIMLYSPLT